MEVIRAKIIRREQKERVIKRPTYSERVQRMIDKHVRRYEEWMDKHFQTRTSQNEK